MARIEIPIDEYNGLKNKIKALEATIVDVSKEAAFYKEKFKDAESLAYDLEAEGFISRLFRWKKIVSPLLELFRKTNDKNKETV
jgi:hypothetical protein